MMGLVEAGLLVLAGGQTPPSAEYKALGTEPFWSLRITRDQLQFDEANQPGVVVSQARPRERASASGHRYYETPRLKAWLLPERCSDGMTERIFPNRVVLLVDGRRFEGCGGKPLSGPEVP